jgi:hypothetical protein
MEFKKFSIIIFVFIVLHSQKILAQAGFYLYTGPSVGWTRDKVYSKEGGNYGYVIGADIRTNNDPMHFLISVERGGTDLVPNGKFNFFGGGDIIYNKFKIGMGFDIKKMSRTSGLRTKFQGNFLTISSFPEKGLDNVQVFKSNGYTDLNDGIIGLSTGLSYYKKKFNFGIEYEYPLYNVIKEKTDTKLNFLNLNIGLKLF